MYGEMTKSNGFHQRNKKKFSKKKIFFFKISMKEQGLKCLSYFGRDQRKNFPKKKKKIKVQ